MSSDPQSSHGVGPVYGSPAPASLAPHVPFGSPTPFVSTVPAYARFWRRFAAAIIDGIILALFVWFCSAFLGVAGFEWATNPIVEPDTPDGTFFYMSFTMIPVEESIFALVTGWLYHAGMQSTSWQASPGKRAVGIVVTDLAGQRISFVRATGRHFAEFLSRLLMAGYLIQPFTEKRQALHDLIAGTLVVKR